MSAMSAVQVADLVRNAVSASLMNEKKLAGNANGAKVTTSKVERENNSSNATSVPKKRRKKPALDQNWKVLQKGLQKNAVNKKRRPLKRQRAPPKSTNSDESGTANAKYSSFMPGQVQQTNQLTKIVALDCEMVGVGKDGRENALARVSVVNFTGDVLLDSFVKVHEEVVDYRTKWSGIRPEDVSPECATAIELFVAQKTVGEILKGRILVGHALRNDLKVLRLSHPARDIRDTSEYFKKLWRKQGRGNRIRPKLQYVVAEVLGVDVFQKGEHDSCEDARAALSLYKKYAKEWESEARKSKPKKAKGNSG